MGLLEPQALLDRVLVDLVDDGVDTVAVQRLVRVGQGALGPGVGYLLDQYCDVHGVPLVGLSDNPGLRRITTTNDRKALVCYRRVSPHRAQVTGE